MVHRHIYGTQHETQREKTIYGAQRESEKNMDGAWRKRKRMQYTDISTQI
jgi:hypothetical protein